MVINHSDRDTVYFGTSFDYSRYIPSYPDTLRFYYFRRFYFPDGYTDRFQPSQPLNLEVYLHY